MPGRPSRWSFPGGWKRSLAAILIGNLLYYALFAPYVPPAAEQPLGINWGLGLDFVLCVAIYRLTARFW